VAGVLHELTLLQEREGWLSEAGLRQLALRLRVPLHRLEGVSSFYTHFRRTPPKGVQVRVCRTGRPPPGSANASSISRTRAPS
jgi:NADH:ubiquinone oxidoreductase subunit E